MFSDHINCRELCAGLCRRLRKRWCCFSLWKYLFIFKQCWLLCTLSHGNRELFVCFIILRFFWGGFCFEGFHCSVLSQGRTGHAAWWNMYQAARKPVFTALHTGPRSRKVRPPHGLEWSRLSLLHRSSLRSDHWCTLSYHTHSSQERQRL